jgi:hypothetical protein
MFAHNPLLPYIFLQLFFCFCFFSSITNTYQYNQTKQTTMYNTTIGEKRAKEIISYVIKEAKVKNVSLPNLEAFVAQGAKAGVILEAYEEFNEAVNNGNNPNSVRLPYEDSLRFRNFVLSYIPTKEQIEMIKHYGVSKIFTFNK